MCSLSYWQFSKGLKRLNQETAAENLNQNLTLPELEEAFEDSPELQASYVFLHQKQLSIDSGVFFWINFFCMITEF